MYCEIDRGAGPAEWHGKAAPVQLAINRGPFSLVDHRWKTVTDEDFLGKFMLVYFGYTHCSDLCPIDLQIMTQAINLLGEQREKLQPVFITVDPKRGTVEVMADYVVRFHHARQHLFYLESDEQVDEYIDALHHAGLRE